MPYIIRDDRKSIHGEVAEELNAIVNESTHSQDLGYVIFHLLWTYLNRMVEEQEKQYPALQDAIQSLRVHMRRRMRMQDTVEWCNEVGAVLQRHPGHYNYVISHIIHEILIREGISYTRLNRIVGVIERIKAQFLDELSGLRGSADEMEALDDVVGVMVCIQLELYAVLARPYEDKKMAENGSVSELDQVFLDRYAVWARRING